MSGSRLNSSIGSSLHLGRRLRDGLGDETVAEFQRELHFASEDRARGICKKFDMALLKKLL